MIDLKKITALAMMLLMGIATVVAQVKITGKVVDEAGKPIEFASVRILGTALGTNTNTKGMYELNVPPKDTIMVEFSCL